MSVRAVQEILDANTRNIPEGLYVQLSNALRDAYNESTDTPPPITFLLEELFKSRLEIEALEEKLDLEQRANTEYRKRVRELTRRDFESKKVVEALSAKLTELTTPTPPQPPQPNKWIQHVRSWSEAHGFKYGVALRNEECRLSYREGIKKQ